MIRKLLVLMIGLAVAAVIVGVLIVRNLNTLVEKGVEAGGLLQRAGGTVGGMGKAAVDDARDVLEGVLGGDNENGQ